MSPNEDQLRAALRDGEGDAPDATRIIADVTRARYERRRRITSIASGVAVVAVLATGIGLLAHAGGDESAGSGASATGAALAPGAQATMRHAPSFGMRTSAGSNAIQAGPLQRGVAACPSTFPRQMVPGGGGTNQFGASGPLFAQPVAALRICSYGPALTGSSVLAAPQAAQLASTLEHASATVRYACAMTVPDEKALALYGVTANGTQLRVVTVDLGCPYQATNGTAVRYLTPASVVALPTTTPPLNQGSPVN